MLIVNTLGKFQITDGNVVLNDDNMRSPTLTKLLVYLIIHRNEQVSILDISEAIWQENDTDNPAGALKNLVYRLRTILKGAFGDNQYILTSQGSYTWNPELPVCLDVEEFEKMYDKAKEESDLSEVLYYLNQASDMYLGDFMAMNIGLSWVVTESVYYHSMYLNIIKKLAELYDKEARYEEMENICNAALKVDNVDEKLYYYLILARAHQGKLQLATETYEHGCQILYNELGIRHPELLEKVYEQLLKTGKQFVSADIDDVHTELIEDEVINAFFCGYPVFKEIYRLEARKLTRESKPKHILMLTLKDKGCPEFSKGLDKKGMFLVKNIIPVFEECLGKSLRIGDVVSQYSDNQYLILLPDCSFENASLVASRIIGRFYDISPKNKNIKIFVSIDEITEASSII